MNWIWEAPDKHIQVTNTCLHNGKVLHFSQGKGKLIVTEIILGEKAESVEAQILAQCDSSSHWLISCCSLGRDVLVVSGDNSIHFAALVSVAEGELTVSSIHLTCLAVSGDRAWANWPFLCRVSGNRTLLYFAGQSGMWNCEVIDTTLWLTKFNISMPSAGGFSSAPVLLPDGRLIVAGADPYSTDITLIRSTGKVGFEKIGNIPGKARCATSVILLGSRFLVGFGGCNRKELGDLWIFDARTRQSSRVRQEGEWHPPDKAVFLVVRNGTLYLIGGIYAASLNSISLLTLASLIRNWRFRWEFHSFLGVPFAVSAAYVRKMARSNRALRL